MRRVIDTKPGATMTSEAAGPRKLALILLTILAVRLVALGLNRTDLFFDEAQYWSWAQEPAFGYYSKPPLIAWLIGATTAICGDGEACVRLASPILHTVTAWAVYLIGRELYDPRVGFWSGVVYATLPGVSVSTGLISTDVPFLLCWALALWAFVRLRQSDGFGDALGLGAAIGLGFLARYGMAFFVGSMLIALWVTRSEGARIGAGRWLMVVGVALVVMSPNLYWNLANGFATLGHTADNAKWSGSLVHPLKALEFLGAQFGVFGPVLFAALLIIVYRAMKQRLPETDRLLLAFALPIILIFVGQAFLSRAHANWAAGGYIAATVLVTATMLRDGARSAFKASLGLHGLFALVMALAPAFAGRLPLAPERDPYKRLLGWREMADTIRTEIDAAARAGKPYAAILIDDRGTLAEQLYYLRDADVPVRAWKSGTIAKDHYELTRPYAGETPALLVSQAESPAIILNAFETTELRLARGPRPDPRAWRPLEFYRLEGYRR
jgi:4-amino-4-deoxy-L-arabinose transferase-like glycosyltransferase